MVSGAAVHKIYGESKVTIDVYILYATHVLLYMGAYIRVAIDDGHYPGPLSRTLRHDLNQHNLDTN